MMVESLAYPSVRMYVLHVQGGLGGVYHGSFLTLNTKVQDNKWNRLWCQ
jgi:hypothetical protein